MKNLTIDTSKGRKSSDCYVLEKKIDHDCYSVIFFHTVINGTKYIHKREYHNYRESHKDRRRLGWIGHNEYVNTEYGNYRYTKYINDGYVFVGKYEMNIYGYLKGDGIYDGAYQEKLKKMEER